MTNFPLPNNVQIELVEGCNRMCDFCGIQGLWKQKQHRKINHMLWETYLDTITQLREWWGPQAQKRIEFAMHGEPLLWREGVPAALSAAREALPKAQLQVTTNGLALTGELLRKLFHSGLNVLIIDQYTKAKELEAIANENAALCGAKVVHYYKTITVKEDADDFNPYHYNGDAKTIVLMGDLGKANGDRSARTILNHAGNADKTKLRALGVPLAATPLRKPCSRPFRELVIHWDGTIPACCLDWKHELILGCTTQGIKAVWNGLPAQCIRYYLQNKRRTLRPCYKCDYNGGFRLGLLPTVELPEGMNDMDVTTYLVDHIKRYNDSWTHPAGRKESIQFGGGLNQYMKIR